MKANELASTFIPSVEIWTALAGGASITLFLLVFSRKPFRLPMTLPRYGAALGGGFLLWGVLLWANHSALLESGFERCLALLAGALIMAAAFAFNYYLGNVYGGFRVEMLVNIHSANRDLDLDEWMGLFGKGKGMRYFLEDRLKTTLIPWRFAVRVEKTVKLTPLGHFAGLTNRFFSWLLANHKV